MSTPVFRKVVRLGSREHVGNVFCAIEYRARETAGEYCLSITGVEGPESDGDCLGSCGQIEMSLGDGSDIEPAPGWTSETIARFLDVWRTWHLNDMRAGCEHQRASWNPSESIELVTYRLTRDTWKDQDKLKADVLVRVGKGEFVQLSPAEIALMALPWETHHAPDADSAGSGRYEVNKRETKLAGWVYPKEHARGLLTKACEVCGYTYGSQWLYEPVPDDVLMWLRALPDTDMKPAWV